MKTIILFLLIVVLSNITIAQTTAIPDANFEQELVNLGLDAVIDGQVLTAHIDTLTTFYINSNVVSNLTGIQDFTALSILNIGPNQLSSLDISQNLALTELYCQSNSLTSLDITQNSNLEVLYCRNNSITSLDVSQNLMLSHLNCSLNQLTSLNVSQNINLTKLECSSNLISSIDLTQNTILNYLSLHANQITQLDVTQNSVLDYFQCSDNLLTTLDVTQIDSLRILDCWENQLTSLDVTQNLALQAIRFQYNSLSSIDLSSQQGTLQELNLSGNLFTELNLSGFPALKHLNCDTNLLSCINIKNGNNQSLLGFTAKFNSSLTCIQVDNPAYSQANWFPFQFWFDSGVNFSSDCADNCSVGIEEKSLSDLSVYPNPTKGNFTIDFGELKQDVTATLTNNLGQVILTQQFESTDIIDMEIDAPAGIHFLQLEIDGKIITKKIIKE
tara:strand:- start:195 stop:1526 length:1332 start_codon:yes stop_codon:yes gene_type:complete